MRVIACTVGTSIAAGIPPFQPADSIDSYREKINTRVEQLKREYSTDFLTRASAESNSLNAMKVTPDDRVVLIHTETPDGRACAEIVARVITDAFGCDEPALKEIKGLQVRDANRFRREGVQNLFSELRKLVDQDSNDLESERNVILNTTGGFKSVVPYVTLFGLLYRLPVIYLFEFSRALITLPPAPISFDYERLSLAHDALQSLKAQGAMSKEAFFSRIPGLSFQDRDWFESLVEEEGGHVTLSAFGCLFAEEWERRLQTQVFLSPRAKRQFEQSGGVPREQFAFMLSLIRDPVWRGQARHAFSATDLQVFKRGSTSERLAAIVRGNGIYVCELLTHDAYERILPTRKSTDYALSEFTLWTQDAGNPSISTESESQFEERRRNREAQLVKDRDDMESLWREAEKDRDLARAELAESIAKRDMVGLEQEIAAQEAHSLRQETARAQSRVAELERELSSRNAQLRELSNRPWWKRLFK